eukprot:TRINITY_DN68164_c8_g6_i1.p1 TRINITY_DN68164_c8_g6~~TRINITY_DN68164_c8_g6_i1.p1  ORF type:complete len:630 (+),score=-19.30 TRINITY_DN68164_c8_g6_i1:51-1940(+)
MSVVTQDKDIELGVVTDTPNKNGDYSKLSSGDAPVSPSKIKKDICWDSVTFTVTTKNEKKTILDNCWGKVDSGEICAIMGPSGAGKSSLLNVLAGRSAAAEGISITGNVYVGGAPINPVTFRKNIAYVMQDDALMATQTPEEVLRFSASLRLPDTTPKKEIDTLVSKTIDDLGLSGCKDVMIGGALIKGISGGQRKRTSIGIEIITDPVLLFLDEPTSGLDSYTAYQIIQLLKDMAKKNTSVLLTIHQPSSEIFFLLDIVVFMKEGRIFYQGPVNEVTTYFSKLGLNCPPNYNPCDYVMSLSQVDSVKELEQKNLFMKVPTPGGDANEGKGRSGSSISLEVSGVQNEQLVEMQSSMWKQLNWLVAREYLNLTRNKAGLAARFGITIFLNLLFGLIFLGAGDRNNANNTNFSAHFGAVTMVTISSMFGSAQPAMLEFPFERPMFMREYVTGTYSALAYFISKSFVELPLTLSQTIVQYILVYNMCGFQGMPVYLVLAAWGLGLASSSVAVALGCAIPDVKNVTEMGPMLFVPQILFAGFFIKMSQVPVFLRWAQYLCAMKYAMNLIIMTEFNTDLPSCDGAARANCERVIEDNSVETDMWYVYMIMLMVLYIGFRILGGIVLVIRSKRFY